MNFNIYETEKRDLSTIDDEPEFEIENFSPLISRDNLYKYCINNKFGNPVYSYKKKSKRMIKKFAKENGLKFVKRTILHVHWSKLKDEL